MSQAEYNPRKDLEERYPAIKCLKAKLTQHLNEMNETMVAEAGVFGACD